MRINVKTIQAGGEASHKIVITHSTKLTYRELLQKLRAGGVIKQV